MLCYKYVSYEIFKKTITPYGVFFKVSRPAEFNDPYDCTGEVVGCASKALEETYNQFTSQILSPLKLDLSVKVQSRRLFDNIYRILSLSDSKVNGTPGDMLMWSHYADYARGVRIGIEIDTSKYHIVKINYAKELPILDLDMVKQWDIYDDETLNRFLKACLLTKHEIWGYENEQRVFFKVNDPEVNPFSILDARRSTSEAMMIWNPDKSVIREVCLGSEFLQKEKTYQAVDNYYKVLFDSGYAFKPIDAIRRKQYGYGLRDHEICSE